MVHGEFCNISKYVSHQMSQNLQVMMHCNEKGKALAIAPNCTACQEIFLLISINLRVLEWKALNTPKTKQTDIFSAIIYLKVKVMCSKPAGQKIQASSALKSI